MERPTAFAAASRLMHRNFFRRPYAASFSSPCTPSSVARPVRDSNPAPSPPPSRSHSSRSPSASARFAVNPRSLRPAERRSSYQKKPRDMRDFYTIREPANLDLTAKAAAASVQNLHKYLQCTPIPTHTRLAFDEFRTWHANRPPGPLCFDVGCGQAASSVRLARDLGPNTNVVGIDKSDARLSRNRIYRTHAGRHDNLLILQADLVHFWRLCFEHRVFPDYQYVFYPNPYPKSSDLKKRWHGHPIFPAFVALGGRVEVRASWIGYLHEFQLSYQITLDLLRQYDMVREDDTGTSYNLSHCDDQQSLFNPQSLNVDENTLVNQVESFTVDSPITSFEQKYANVGLPVYRLVIDRRDPNQVIEYL